MSVLLLVLLRARPAAPAGRLGGRVRGVLGGPGGTRALGGGGAGGLRLRGGGVLGPSARAPLGLGVFGLGAAVRLGLRVLGRAGRPRLGAGLARRVDALHLEPGQGLAVALVVALAALVLVGEHPQLLAAVVADHGSGDLRADQLARPRAHLAFVVHHQQRDELDVAAAVVAGDVLHVDDVTDLDLVLLSASADDGVHVSTVLSVPQGAADPNKTGARTANGHSSVAL